jgi:hypothetical protein
MVMMVPAPVVMEEQVTVPAPTAMVPAPPVHLFDQFLLNHARRPQLSSRHRRQVSRRRECAGSKGQFHEHLSSSPV